MPRPGLWFPVLLCATLLAACATTGPRMPDHYDVKAVPGAVLVKTARSQMGVPYATGGRDPSQGFDCSGLVWWCYAQSDSAVPRKVHEQYKMGRAIPRTGLQPGDLVFFDSGLKPKPSHVGIYVGHGRFIHAPSSGERVREDELGNNYWKKTFYGARRVD